MGFMDTLKGWFGTAKETAGEVAEKTKPAVDKAVAKAKETAGDVAEKTKPAVDKAVAKAKETAGDLGERASGMVSKRGDHESTDDEVGAEDEGGSEEPAPE